MKLKVIYMYVFVLSCMDVKSVKEDEVFLNIYMNSEMTGSHYLVKYNSTKDHSYTSVYYQTDGLRYIEWFSDDEFCVLYTIFNLINGFKGSRVVFDIYRDKINEMEIYSFWGLNSKVYGLRWDPEVKSWYIYHTKYTNGKKEYINY